MSKQGIFLAIAENQEGASPSIVTANNPLPIRITDAEGNDVVEQFSDAVKVIDTEHAHIHNGNVYQLSGTITGLASTASAYILIDPTTPIHWRYFKFTADGGPFDIEFFENPTTTADGADQTPINRNRLSANTSASNIYEGPTVTDDGSRLDIATAISTGTGVNAAGELEGVVAEWIIDGDNTYLLKITNNDNGTLDFTYRFFWYEL